MYKGSQGYEIGWNLIKFSEEPLGLYRILSSDYEPSSYSNELLN